MLPFLKPKRETGLIIKTRTPDGNMSESAPDEKHEPIPGMKAVAADLIRAINAKDEDGVSAALCAAFDLYESKEEDEHSEEPEQE